MDVACGMTLGAAAAWRRILLKSKQAVTGSNCCVAGVRLGLRQLTGRGYPTRLPPHVSPRPLLPWQLQEQPQSAAKTPVCRQNPKKITAECVVQVAYEVVPVVWWQAHKGAAHEDELHLVYHMTQLEQLVNTPARLKGGEGGRWGGGWGGVSNAHTRGVCQEGNAVQAGWRCASARVSVAAHRPLWCLQKTAAEAFSLC